VQESCVEATKQAGHASLNLRTLWLLFSSVC
jgi:hypothetical protein